MSRGRKLHFTSLLPGLALLALVTIFGATPSFADRGAKATRSSGGSQPGAVSHSAPSAGGSSSRGVSRASSTRSGPRTAVSTRQSTPATRRAVRGPRRHHRHHGYGFHLGFGHHYYPWSFYWGPGYSYYPYYWGVPYWGGPYRGGYGSPRRTRAAYELGAFDLNVRPRKTEVFLNGQAIGPAKRYDGWPDYLWLQEGSYELIFYRPGFATERRVLRIIPGVVSDVRLELAPGEARAPSEISEPPAPYRERARALTEVEEAYRRQAETRQAAPAPPPASAQRDTRTPPGRVRLKVLPADASVYLDGRLLGSGEELSRLHAGLVVEAGSHLLEVVRPGYATEQLEFEVEEEAEVELEVLLEAG